MKHAFIFDFDGVIVDSELYWDTYSLATYQAIVPEFTAQDDSQLKGRNMHDIYAMLVDTFGLQLSKEAYIAHLGQLTERIYGSLCKPLPGVLALAQRLHQMGLKVAIASSSERAWIDRTVRRLEIEGMFGPIVTAKDVGIGKPDPAVYLEAARRLGVAPADCIALEDSTNGVRSAKAAGMTCVALVHTTGYTQDLSAADLRIHHCDELTKEVLHTL